MNAQQWVEDVQEAIRLYSQQRQTTPVVRVTLVDGVARFVMRFYTGPGDQLVTINAYPDDVNIVENLVAVPAADGGHDRFTRDAVLVEPDKILKPDQE